MLATSSAKTRFALLRGHDNLGSLPVRQLKPGHDEKKKVEGIGVE
jgi:hypothetical protein